jgi:hypothetical protein
MWIVRTAVGRPYTFIVATLLHSREFRSALVEIVKGDGGGCTTRIVDGQSERLGKSKSLRGESRWLSNKRKTMEGGTPGKKLKRR